MEDNQITKKNDITTKGDNMDEILYTAVVIMLCCICIYFIYTLITN